MAIAIYIHPQSMTAAQYDEARKLVDEAGSRNPKGMLHHSCFGPPDALMVYDVWESQEDFDKYGEVLMPILAKVGIDPGTPDIMPVHHLIQ